MFRESLLQLNIRLSHPIQKLFELLHRKVARVYPHPTGLAFLGPDHDPGPLQTVQSRLNPAEAPAKHLGNLGSMRLTQHVDHKQCAGPRRSAEESDIRRARHTLYYPPVFRVTSPAFRVDFKNRSSKMDPGRLPPAPAHPGPNSGNI